MDSRAMKTLGGGEAARLRRRRGIFLGLVVGTMLALIAALTMLLLAGGLSLLDVMLVLLFALNLPWLVIGLWNAVIGFVLLRLIPDGVRRVFPRMAAADRPPAQARVALVVPVHEEDPESVLCALRATVASLDASGHDERFHVFLLSDTRDEALALREEALWRAWREQDARPGRLHYRRRAENVGYKAGNIADFCARWGHDYAYMLVLDADSVMSGETIRRLVAEMDANPRLGILQTLIVGLPARGAFARIFQFGMRHGMRAYTMGSAWWQGDAGPYWGHNAIVRLAPFIAHCQLPRVPGGPPLGGDVLSHDQIEAVLMRRAGWEVRALPTEVASFEANPPTLLDFIRRDLRWCLGNMQYTRLLPIAGAHRLGRVQMLLAILMYTAAPCWLAFFLVGLLQLLAFTHGFPDPLLLDQPVWLPDTATLAAVGFGLLFAIVAMSWAPKLMGLAHALSDRDERRRYGGGWRIIAGTALELSFSALLAPVAGTAQTIFLAGLLCGRRLTWTSQVRIDRRLTFGEAARWLWPQTLLGLLFSVGLAAAAPQALPWAGPMVLGLLLAIPFAVGTTSRRLGRLLVRTGLFATPEELAPLPEVRAACPWLAPAHELARARRRIPAGALPLAEPAE